jgi:RNA polymerase sigma-70 factor (ECF subfamily)
VKVVTADVEELLRHAAWMRRLAGTLVRDRALADDLAQETWVQALQHPPRAGETVRPWLGEVLRNVLRGRLRSEKRRDAREQASDTLPAPSAEELVGSVELHKLLAGEVLALDEPYRSTLLLRFYEGLSAAEIAEKASLPAGTVRWRLKEGLDQLRARLDRKHEGDRAAWLRALAPLTGNRNLPGVKGATIVKLLLATSVVAIAAAGVSLHHRQSQPAPSPAQKPPVAAPPAATAPVPVKEKRRFDPQVRAQLLKKLENVPRKPLDKEYVREQMRELLPLVKECFENALERLPNLSGKIVVDFTIVGDPSVGGLVGDSQVVDAKTTIADAEVRECIQETMYAAKFPPPDEGGEWHVQYPFVLIPADDDKE